MRTDPARTDPARADLVAPRRGYAKGRARREEILDAATTLFGEVGYRSASLREIAQRVGISHPGLLHHFGGKEQLLAAVLAHRDERDDHRFGLSGARGRGALRALVELVADNARHPGIVELYCVLSAEATSPEHPAHRYFRDRYARTVAAVARHFAEIAAEGGLRPGVDPRAAAVRVVALMDGLQVQWLLDRTCVDMAAEVRAHLDGLLVEPLG
ncbi:TetR/AcrR family transcriptional regulator [Kineococcus glutinatus]|uniref:TetR/AcrR family transcriptional regulator n=1 Tax=Kineococcus glutinatus TaxID=1070872 RepID=UPI0031EDFF20